MIRHLIGACLAATLAGPASAQLVFLENFNDNLLDEDLWQTVDSGAAVSIDETGGRLEFSSSGAPGQAGIYANDWAIATDGDIRLTIDFNLTVANTGQAAAGLNLALYQGSDPAVGTVDDQVDIGIFRQGALYYLQWFVFDDGVPVASDTLVTQANTGTLYFFYDESSDRLWVSAMGFGNQPDAVAIDDLVTLTGAQHLQLYLGGFVNGNTNAVAGDDAWADRVRVMEGMLLDLALPDVEQLGARDDADWFRRGDAAGDRLGWSARFAGDLDADDRAEIAVGVPRDDTSATNAGSVSVFSGDDGALIFESHGEAAGDLFGFAVDDAGDWNNDGVSDVIVGAPRYDTTEHVNAGKVYVLSGVAPHSVLWSKEGEATGDNFGYTVAGIGDVNNDGFDDVLVGAPFSDAGGGDAGRCYVYLGSSGSRWARKTGQAAGDQFGRTITGAGDVDDDGDPDYLIAAPFNDQGGSSAGKVYVYAGDSNQRLLSLIGRSPGDRLGWSADAAGDLNGDNHADLLLGASHDDSTATNAGAAFVYSGADGSILLELDGEAADDRFGTAVAAVRDIDGDGLPELAVNAPRADTGPNNTGRVSVFSGVDGALLVIIDGESGGNQFGSVLDADRQSTSVFVSLIGGAWRFKSGDLNKRGSVYRFDFVAP